MVIFLENCMFCDIKSFIHAKGDQDKTNGQRVQRCIQNPVNIKQNVRQLNQFRKRLHFGRFIDNIGQNVCRIFYLLTQLSFINSEAELDYYQQRMY